MGYIEWFDDEILVSGGLVVVVLVDLSYGEVGDVGLGLAVQVEIVFFLFGLQQRLLRTVHVLHVV